MNVLILNLKKEWYNLIESGIKTEEYREIKPYWIKRLTEFYNVNNGIYDCVEKHYDMVKIVYGYTKRSMLFEYKGLSIGKANPIMVNNQEEWLKDDYFVIQLGRRIE